MVWKSIQTHLSFVLFLVVLILFWFGLELSMDKDQKMCKETCRYIKGFAVKIFLKP